MGNFLSCGFDHGKFFCRGKLLTMWFWSWKFFWTCDLGHGNFGHVILVMGIFLDMWFWSWEIFGHVILVMGIF